MFTQTDQYYYNDYGSANLIFDDYNGDGTNEVINPLSEGNEVVEVQDQSGNVITTYDYSDSTYSYRNRGVAFFEDRDGDSFKEILAIGTNNNLPHLIEIDINDKTKTVLHEYGVGGVNINGPWYDLDDDGVDEQLDYSQDSGDVEIYDKNGNVNFYESGTLTNAQMAVRGDILSSNSGDEMAVIFNQNDHEVRIYDLGGYASNPNSPLKTVQTSIYTSISMDVFDIDNDNSDELIIPAAPGFNVDTEGYVIDDGVASEGVKSGFSLMSVNNYRKTNTAPAVDSTAYDPAVEYGNNGIDIFTNVSDPDGDSLSVNVSVTEGNNEILSSTEMNTGTTSDYQFTDAFNVDEYNVYYNVTFEVSDGTTTTEYEESFYIGNNKPVIHFKKSDPLNPERNDKVDVYINTTDIDGPINQVLANVDTSDTQEDTGNLTMNRFGEYNIFRYNDTFKFRDLNTYYNVTYWVQGDKNEWITGVDTFYNPNTAPSIDSTSVEPNPPLRFNDNVNVLAEASDSENNLDRVDITIRESGTVIVDNQTLNNLGGGSFRSDNLFTVDENLAFYNISYYAFDNRGLSSKKTDAYFIQNQPPRIDSVDTVPEEWNVDDNITLNVEASDETGIDNVQASVYENGTLIVSNQTLTESGGTYSGVDLFGINDDGQFYNVTVYAEDIDGKTSSAEISQFIISEYPEILNMNVTGTVRGESEIEVSGFIKSAIMFMVIGILTLTAMRSI
jgi:hypothetical protein